MGNTVFLASRTGVIGPIVPGTTAVLLYVDREAMAVQSVNPNTGGITVERGYLGTQPTAHNSGATVLYGRTDIAAQTVFYTFDPAGACVSTNAPNPWVNVSNANQWTCTGGVWVVSSAIYSTGTGLPAGPTSPNGVKQGLTSTPSGGVAGAATYSLAGVTPNVQSGSNYAIAATDRGGLVILNNASPQIPTIPQAGSGGGTNNDFTNNFVVKLCNQGAGTQTLTPTTSTLTIFIGTSAAPLTGQTSLAILQNQCYTLYSDNTNYIATFDVNASVAPGCSTACSWYPIWVSPPTAMGNQVMSTAANQPVLFRYTKSTQDTVTRIGYHVGTLSAASTGDIGAYGNCTTTCTLLWHTGSFSTAATGAFSVTITPVVVGPGTYYAATCNSSTTPTLDGGTLSGFQATIIEQGVANVAGSDGNAGDACTAGVLPNTITIANITNGSLSLPFIAVSN